MNKNKYIMLTIGASLLFLALMTAGAFAADFNISTTSHFDAGFKSNSSGNYEIETVTDNPSITANKFKLGNMFGDSFTFDDADGLTFKWSEEDTGNWGAEDLTNMITAPEISSGRYWWENSLNDANTVLRKLNAYLSADFDMRINFNWTHKATSYREYVLAYSKADASAYAFILITFDGASYTYFCDIADGAAVNSASGAYTTDYNETFRITRVSGTVSVQIDNGVGGWNTYCSDSGGTGESIYPFIYSSDDAAGDPSTVYLNDWNITGTLLENVNTPYRTSGNWTSATQTMTGNYLENTTLIFSNLNTSHGIVNVTWLVSGVEVAHYDTNITSGTDLTINASDTNVSLNTITNDFKVRLYLTGNGTSTPVIKEIYGDFFTQIYTAIPSINFNISAKNISTTAYTEITKKSINISNTTNFTIFSSMNFKKVTGASTNNLWARILINDVTVHEENLRTLSGLLDEGAVMLSPTNFTVTGNFNISMEVNRSGTGIVELNDIDFILIKTEAADDGDEIRSNKTTTFYNFSSTSYTPAFNWTITKTTNSTTFIIGKQTINKSAAGDDVASFYFRHSDDAENSSIWERYLSSATDIGSVLGIQLDLLESGGTHNHTIMSKSTGSMIGATTTIFDMDLRDNNSHLINSFSQSSATTTINTNKTFTNGTHNLTVANFTMQNGSNLFLAATTSFKSDSGKQTPTIILNSSNATLGDCYSKKERKLSSSKDIGTVGIFTICTGLTAGNTYQFNLLLVVESGESIIVIDEQLAGFETEPIVVTVIITPTEFPGLPLSLWTWFAVISIVLLLIGFTHAVRENNPIILFLSIPFLLTTGLAAFSILTLGLSVDTITRSINSYPSLAMLFISLFIFAAAMALISVVSKLSEDK